MQDIAIKTLQEKRIRFTVTAAAGSGERNAFTKLVILKSVFVKKKTDTN